MFFLLRNAIKIVHCTSVACISPAIVALGTVLGLDVVGLNASNLGVVSVAHYDSKRTTAKPVQRYMDTPFTRRNN